MRTTNADPLVDVMQAGGWLNRCTGTKPTGVKTRLPASLVIADVTSRGSQPNNHLVILQPDGVTIVQISTAARCRAGGPLYGYVYGAGNSVSDIRGDGRRGSHASQISALGGIIRNGELTSSAPIDHALDLELFEGDNYFWNGSKASCFQWPASGCDDYAGQSYGYHGTDPQLRIGALLAIPPNVRPEDLGVNTAVGRKLFAALKNYGGYATESTAWSAYNVAVESGANTFPSDPATRAELARMIAATRVVTSNTPGRVPDAPAPPATSPGKSSPGAKSTPTTRPSATRPANPVPNHVGPTAAGVGGSSGKSSSSGGYWVVGQDCRVTAFGQASYMGDMSIRGGCTAVARTTTGNGYWLAASDGTIGSFGDAPAMGSVPVAGGESLVTVAANPSGSGLWAFTSRGRVIPKGGAAFFGDASSLRLAGSIVAATPTPSGKGYWLIGSDGGVFSYGDAKFYGSMGGKRLKGPIVDMVPKGAGYLLVASDGGVFAFGQAGFRGSMGGKHLNRPVVGAVGYGDGYLMVAADGGIFSFSDRPFAGSLASENSTRSVTDVTPS